MLLKRETQGWWLEDISSCFCHKGENKFISVMKQPACCPSQAHDGCSPPQLSLSPLSCPQTSLGYRSYWPLSFLLCTESWPFSRDPLPRRQAGRLPRGLSSSEVMRVGCWGLGIQRNLLLKTCSTMLTSAPLRCIWASVW